MRASTRLEELGITLPTGLAPVALYKPAVVTGSLCYVSGNINQDANGDLTITGKVGGEVSLEQAREAARLAAINALAGAVHTIGSIDRITKVVRITGYVNGAPGFDQPSKVIDGASELLRDLFGEDGIAARSAIGLAELPFSAPVEVELILEIRAERRS